MTSLPSSTVEENYLVGETKRPRAFPAWPTLRSTWHFAAAPSSQPIRPLRFSPNWAAITMPILSRTSRNISRRYRRKTWKCSPCGRPIACEILTIPRGSGHRARAPFETGSIARSIQSHLQVFWFRMKSRYVSPVRPIKTCPRNTAFVPAHHGAMLKTFQQKWYAPNNAIPRDYGTSGSSRKPWT